MWFSRMAVVVVRVERGGEMVGLTDVTEAGRFFGESELPSIIE